MLKKFVKKYLKNQRGLTLVELLAVIVILGIIAAIAVPNIGNIIGSSKEKAHKANALMLMDAARLYYVENSSTTNNDLDVDEINSVLVAGGYLDAVPNDPAADTAATYANINIVRDPATNSFTITLGNTDEGAEYINAKTKEEINSAADFADLKEE